MTGTETTGIELTVNGKRLRGEVAPRTLLVDFLRDHLLLTGTHVGCEHGICGACTIEIDGEIARSCITYALQCDGARVNTIEGFDDDALMERLRRAFTQEHALQCGYCTPGMLIAARDLIRRGAAREERDVRVAMSGNLCRCTGYQGIVRAIARVLAEGAPAVPCAKPAWLGPAPGPVAAPSQPTAAPSARTAAMRDRPILPSAPPARMQIDKVEIGADGSIKLAQSIELRHTRDAVWRFMAEIEKVAACLPGASLDGPLRDGRFAGRMSVKFGPMTASFGGEGVATRNEGDYSGAVEGQGRDARSATRAKGRIAYRLIESGPGATTLAMEIGYSLAGPLAQFSRGAMVRDLVARIGAAFAQNLEARLGDPDAAPVGAKLNVLALFWSALIERVNQFIGRITGKQPR